MIYKNTRKNKTINIIPFIDEIKKLHSSSNYFMRLKYINGQTIKHDIILKLFSDKKNEYLYGVEIERTCVWLENEYGEHVLPMRQK